MQPCVFLDVQRQLVCAQQGRMDSLPSFASLFMCPELWGEGGMLFNEWIYRTQSSSALWTIPICSDCLSGSDLLHHGIGVTCVTCVTWAGRTNLRIPPFPPEILLYSVVLCCAPHFWAVWTEPAQLCVHMHPPVFPWASGAGYWLCSPLLWVPASVQGKRLFRVTSRVFRECKNIWFI